MDAHRDCDKNDDDRIRLAVVGGRNITDRQWVYSVIDRYLASLPLPQYIVTGSCRGVDRFAAEYARANAIPLTVHQPTSRQDYLNNNNDKIVAACTHLLAMPQNASSGGTLDAVEKARRQGRPVHIVEYDAGQPPAKRLKTDANTTTTTTTTTTDTIDTIDTNVVPYRPWRAWEDWVPARVFDYRGCDAAKQYARATGLAMFALEVSDQSPSRNFVVGTWNTLEDMLCRRELYESCGPTTLMLENPGALGAVYECLFGDQTVRPFFDLEFWADADHHNERLANIYHMDRMSHLVAHMASALMAELFPHQVHMVVPSPGERREIGLSYDPPAVVTEGTVWADLDPERDWLVLDASKGVKRSQHLILGPRAEISWDTQQDQAIFVGLLIRRIYRAAFALDSVTLDDPFRDAARSLFVRELYGKSRQLIWKEVLDASVYKTFQQVRTAHSSKRGQDRPLVYRRDPFPKQVHVGLQSITETLHNTLIGRVPTGHATVRLSFAQCYPKMFGLPSTTDLFVDTRDPAPQCTANLSMSEWAWVPNYTVGSPPRLVMGAGNATEPWQVPCLRASVSDWLTLSRPVPAQPTRVEKYDIIRNGRGEPSSDQAVFLARFIRRVPELHPWTQGGVDALAACLHIRATRRRNIRTGAVFETVLVDPRISTPGNRMQPYCPIQRRQHKSGRPFLIINGRTGVVRVACLANKCYGQRRELSCRLLPEERDVVFAVT